MLYLDIYDEMVRKWKQNWKKKKKQIYKKGSSLMR